ncbi:disease resistance protein RUN1-like [Argentina anserina]|uniref:disease resistance protein RUN1-like n=1 Tax=Argentina anserina TaxID=57926 RepID=UPI0021765852|nr:disease resistance protein RUN1-like [Potentilla anserina]
MFCRHESSAIQELTKEISDILNYYTFLIANKRLVGLNERMKKLLPLYNAKSECDALMIGILGMGGIGKTTLAQEVFKGIRDQFDASAFVADVRERCQKVDGLITLQRLMYGLLLDSDENIQNVDMGINLLRSRLLTKKVLIILDDADQLKQIEALVARRENGQRFNPSLGSGSLVIITTRDEHLLRAVGVDYTHKAEILKEDEAFKLFCQRAFGTITAPSEYKSYSRDFVKYAGGLPLALEVLGSNLCGRTVLEWSASYARLEGGPGKGILGVLQTSFDGLEDTEKKIFLDIACFFKGEDQDRVKRIFDSCGFFPDIGINILVDKSLIRIEGNKLCMHDLLQQLGWRIVHEEDTKEPGKRSRLWVNEYNKYTRRRSWIDDVLVENQGTNAVESIYLSLPAKEAIQWNDDPFQYMGNLRLLKICNVTCIGMLRFLSRKLRVLEWHEYHLGSLPPSFQPDKLVEHELIELKMPNSCIEHLWNERLSLKMLSLVDLSYCRWLTKTPSFSNVPNLDKLILEGCENLSKLHTTVWDLQHLVLLNLKHCTSLESLPNSISLKSLRIFTLSGCSKLQQFPENVSNMQALLELHVDGTAIQELPVAIQHFTGLHLLDLRGCVNLSNLPNAICGLTSLKNLYLSGCPRIDRLPQNLKSLEHLEEIDVSGTGIKELPPSLLPLKKLRGFHGCNNTLIREEDAAGCAESLKHNYRYRPSLTD